MAFTTQAQYRDLRLRLARSQVPRILLVAGIVTLVFGVVNYLTIPGDTTWAINAVFGPLFILLALLTRDPRVPGPVLPWTWALASLALVIMLVLAYVGDPTAPNLAYIIAVMTAFGPITHAWPPFAVASALMLIGCWVGFAAVPGVSVVPSLLVCFAAIFISAALLWLRMREISALAQSQARLDHEASVDQMTGALNRHGFDQARAALVATAQRADESVIVWFVDVKGLKSANDTMGHRFGDTLISAVAHSLRACVRANDLVVRWGGDEFLVVGTGRAGSAEELNERLDELLAHDEELAGRWPARVTVGVASGPSDCDVDDLISAADADMYRRRQRPPHAAGGADTTLPNATVDPTVDDLS
jgi:diguanylate cyclase (GGDEF)-like protein